MPIGTISDIQSMIDALPKNGAYLRVPAGEYTGDGSITMSGFSASSLSGRTVIDMDGVWFTGEGYFVIEASKNITLRGLRATGFDFHIKGMWLSAIENCDFKRHIYTSNSAASFGNSFWNSFRGGTIQQIVFHENLIHAANANHYYNVKIASSAYGNSIEFRANTSVKGLRFWGGDISYATSKDWKIGTNNTTGPIECIGYGVYFDSGRGKPTEMNESNPKRFIKWVDCVYWGN